VKRSSFASESSRSETSTLIRAVPQHGGSASANDAGLVVRVVQEVLLRLVENEVHVTSDCARRAPRRRAVRRAPPLRRLGERDVRILAPAREHDDERSSASSRSERATAARRSDDFPTPLGP
jgi:hypothetical protein